VPNGLSPSGDVKAERVAVAASVRGTGVGRALMEAVEGEARARGARGVSLGAQTQAIPFYEAVGYSIVEGRPVYLDAGIDHRDMRRDLG